MNNHIVSNVLYEITHPFPNFNSAAIKVQNGNVISSHTLLGMYLLIYPGIKVYAC